MDLSHCDAFRPCSRESSGNKGQFCLPVQYCYFKTVRLQLTTEIQRLLSTLNLLNLLLLYKATADIYNLLQKSAALLLVT